MVTELHSLHFLETISASDILLHTVSYEHIQIIDFIKLFPFHYFTFYSHSVD